MLRQLLPTRVRSCEGVSRVGAIIFAASLSWALSSTSPALAAEKLTVAEGAHVIGYLAVYIAQSEGFFAKEGLDVDIVPTRGSAQAVAAIVGGSADVALATVSDIANAVAHGRDLKLIAAITDQPQMMLTVSTEFAKKHNLSASSSLEQKVKALKGGKFGVSTPGSMTDDVIRTLLKMAGLSPDQDAQILALGGKGGEMLSALSRNSIDGFVLSPPAGNQAEAEGKGIVLVNLMSGEVPKYRDMMFQVVASTPSNIKSKHDQLTTFVKAIAQAQNLIAKDKPKALELGQRAFPNIDPKVLKSAFNIAYDSFSKNPVIPEAGVNKALDFVPKKGSVTANTLTDNSIANIAH
jgi:NitT/TauT family transport system substrate-binding protein